MRRICAPRPGDRPRDCDCDRIETNGAAAAGPLGNGPGLNLAANYLSALKAVQRGGDHQGADVSRRTLTDINRGVLREPKGSSLPLAYFWDPKVQVSNGHPLRTVVDSLAPIWIKDKASTNLARVSKVGGFQLLKLMLPDLGQHRLN